ncbi:MAG: hypothetical protein PHI06_07545 [Desulfobulbaceae bacterium]|nr:hypothetical protein [Desulfobulbaceae bacterium]
MTLDAAHDLGCVSCHNGVSEAREKQLAHTGLVGKPAHPEQMKATCGSCHAEIVGRAASTLHFTVANKINLVLQAFGAKERLTSLVDIPICVAPTTRLQLAEDLLRRRCLRCHLYSAGDAYAATRHGTGCAACHLAFDNGSLRDHRFLARPTDWQCLSCHYGNRVGADYYGRFEHDYNWDYRTPFQAKAVEESPPYGVGFHQLSPDLHQQAGMSCIDCHGNKELMAGEGRLTCLTCHAAVLGKGGPTALKEVDGHRQLILRLSTKILDVPLMRNEAHERYGRQVACQVCHGQWSFADHGNHLLLQDTSDYLSWQALTRQGSAELERELNAALFHDDDAEPSMVDGITGISRPGVWLQAYELRRWEEMNTCLDEQGVLQVCRPLLDLHLSYVNQDNEVVFDGVKPSAKMPVMQPYTPHTTGRAGAFYQGRLQGLSAP